MADTRNEPAWVRRSSAAIEHGTEVFLQRRRPAWPIAIMRVLYGITLFAWTATLAIDANDLLGPDAVVPPEFAEDRWHLVDLDSTGVVWVTLIALLVASIAITVGWRPTGWLVVSFVLLVAVQRRNPLILNSGDLLLRDFALLFALMPTGAALSVDRWRRHGRAALRSAPMVAPWGLRLMQLQMMAIYFFAFWSKSGPTWREGTAVSTVFRIGDLTRFESPEWVTTNVLIIAVLTWGALAIEISLAMLLWVKRLRPLLIVLGMTLHLFIDLFVIVGFFGPLMMLGLVSFADADWIDRRVGQRWRVESAAGSAAESSAESPTDLGTARTSAEARTVAADADPANTVATT